MPLSPYKDIISIPGSFQPQLRGFPSCWRTKKNSNPQVLEAPNWKRIQLQRWNPTSKSPNYSIADQISVQSTIIRRTHNLNTLFWSKSISCTIGVVFPGGSRVAGPAADTCYCSKVNLLHLFSFLKCKTPIIKVFSLKISAISPPDVLFFLTSRSGPKVHRWWEKKSARKTLAK